MDTYSEVAAPRRRAERRDALSIPVVIFSAAFDAPVEVEAADLSPGGAFLVSDLLLPEGEKVLIAFMIPGTWHRVLVDAHVARTHTPDGATAGMGLEFSKLPYVDETALRRALERRRAAIRTFRPDGGFRC